MLGFAIPGIGKVPGGIINEELDELNNKNDEDGLGEGDEEEEEPKGDEVKIVLAGMRADNNFSLITSNEVSFVCLILSGSPCEYIGSHEFLRKFGEIEEEEA
jgi:hypothetical protein